MVIFVLCLGLYCVWTGVVFGLGVDDSVIRYETMDLY